MFLLYHSDRCNTSETVFQWCYVKDLHTTHAVACWVTTGTFKYHLANWSLVSKKRSLENLGIPNLVEMNLCLLASWTMRFQLGGHKFWKQIIDYKYVVNDPNIMSMPSSTTMSPFWEDVLWVTRTAK
jgi:hypothetical protein